MEKIDFDDISLEYGKGDTRFEALCHMDFQVKAGEFISIIGSSGCGKSTTLSILAGLQTPTKGKLLIDGQECLGTGTNRGVVFQHYSLFPWMTAMENVRFGIQQADREITKRRASEIAGEYLERVGLTEFENTYPYQLSGGMQQRVAIARTMAMKPEILLLDEPFGAIDARNRILLQDFLQNILQREEQNKTVVLVTHDIDEAILLSDRVLFMEQKHVTEKFNIPFSRPRNRSAIFASNEYGNLRQRILHCFFSQHQSAN